MDTKSWPFWLHAYSGRENGLMVVGDLAALRELGQRLVDASADNAKGGAVSLCK